MSRFISSFLVEPVVRQARRFSRPSTGNESTPREEQPLLYGHEHPDSGQATTSPQEIEHHFLNLGNHPLFQDPSISGQPVVLSPTSEIGGLEAELQALQHLQSSSSGTLDRQDSSSGRERTNSRLEDGSSSNPLHRIAERFRSTNTSHSSSIYSLDNPDMTPADGSVLSRRYTGQEGSRRGTGSYNSRMADGMLPADDGMGTMRRRIIEIQKSELPITDKSRLIHELMTHEYSSSQSSLHARNRSPASLRSQERPLTPNSGHSTCDIGQDTSPSTSHSSATETDSSFSVSPEDLKPTYYSKPSLPELSRSTETATPDRRRSSPDREDDTVPLGCAHYRRNVKLQCSTCHRWYTCRFCHDEVEDHSLNRRETKNMLCMLCGCAQPASGECSDCGVRSAWYYCGVCKLWDDDPQKSIYHCDDCGICRIGQGLGKDFYHCKTCVVCLSISIRDTHRCIERSTDCDCPICGEYMFTSPQTVVFMRCGHSIHHRCYYEHMKNSYRCPICSRSIINMEMQFRQLDRAIEGQPMPPQFQDTKAWIYCNDCCAKTSVKYHWLGLKCAVCDSYNTAQIRMLSEAAQQTEIVTSDEYEAALVSDDVDLFASETLPSSTRGRSTHSSGVASRPASSVSALDRIRTTAPYDSLRRTFRSSSPRIITRTPPITESINTTSDDIDPMETDDEDDLDDVDFWGRQSPRERARHETGMVETGSVDDSDEGDDDDELMDDELEDDDDDGEGDDRMEIFGHR